MSEIMGLLAQQEAFNKVGVMLWDLVSPGDEYIYFTMNYMGPFGQGKCWAVRPDGKSETFKGRANSLKGPESPDFDLELGKLRQACFREGKGTWFGIEITVTPDGAATAEYNYDRDPEWTRPIEPTIYVQEQEKFPRDVEHQPEWFKQRLAEGRVALDEYRRDPAAYYRQSDDK